MFILKESLTKDKKMTAFQKDEFRWDGMYLHYTGRHENSKTFDELYPESCHPSNVGRIKPEFIARFKYGRKPYKTWINFLVKHFTVEEYLGMIEMDKEGTLSPLDAMRSRGFKTKNPWG